MNPIQIKMQLLNVERKVTVSILSQVNSYIPCLQAACLKYTGVGR